jgi:hypothetical protein
MDPTQVTDRSMVHEPVAGDAQDANRDVAQDRIGHARLLDRLQHATPEATGHDALLERHDQPSAAGSVHDRRSVERLGEPGIDDSDAPALGGQSIGRVQRAVDDRPEPDEQQVVALAQDLGPADRQHLGLDRVQPEPGVAWVVQRERVVLGERGPQQ